ncbi:5'/3'-nucleotidase SurE, partial [Shewanella sp. C31]|nr:5'/3'-nucleotidase SurE [Shewanella electrica]
VFLNVNFPAGTPRGVMVTRLSTHRWEDRVVERLDPEGKPYYWIAGTPVGEEEEGTDLFAVRRGYISITPVSLDVTATDLLEEVR